MTKADRLNKLAVDEVSNLEWLGAHDLVEILSG